MKENNHPAEHCMQHPLSAAVEQIRYKYMEYGRCRCLRQRRRLRTQSPSGCSVPRRSGPLDDGPTGEGFHAVRGTGQGDVTCPTCWAAIFDILLTALHMDIQDACPHVSSEANRGYGEGEKHMPIIYCRVHAPRKRFNGKLTLYLPFRSRGRHCLRVVSSIVSLLSSTALVFLCFFVKI